MTKKEAIIMMQNGYRVKHYLFSDDEYIYMKDNHLYDENNYLMEQTLPNGVFIDFWTDRQDDLWDDGWIVLPNILDQRPNETLIIQSIPRYVSPFINIITPKEKYISKNSHKRTNKKH